MRHRMQISTLRGVRGEALMDPSEMERVWIEMDVEVIVPFEDGQISGTDLLGSGGRHAPGGVAPRRGGSACAGVTIGRWCEP